MHDSSLMKALMKRIDALAQQHGARRVSAVRVRLGRLAHMSPAHFREHFAESSAGGIAEAAAVQVEESDELYDLFLVDVEVES